MNKEEKAEFLHDFIIASAAFFVDADDTLWDWEEDFEFVSFLEHHDIKDEFKKVADDYSGYSQEELQDIKDYEGRQNR